MNLPQAAFPELQTLEFLLQTSSDTTRSKYSPHHTPLPTPRTLPHSHLSHLEIKAQEWPPGLRAEPGSSSPAPPSCLCPRVVWSPAGLVWAQHRWSRAAPGWTGLLPVLLAWEGWDAELIIPSSAAGTPNGAAGARTAWLPPWPWKCSKCCAKLRLHPGGGADPWIVPCLGMLGEAGDTEEGGCFISAEQPDLGGSF